MDGMFPWKELGIFVSYTLTGILGMIVKTVWDATQELRTDLSKLREEIARDYMPRVEVRDMLEQVLDAVKSVGSDLKSHEQREMAWHKETVDQVHKMHVEQARHEAAQKRHRAEQHGQGGSD
jgi:hypothetical protein